MSSFGSNTKPAIFGVSEAVPRPRRRLKDTLTDYSDGLDVLIQKTKAMGVEPQDFESMNLGHDQGSWVRAIYSNSAEECLWGAKKLRKYVCGDGSEGHAHELITWNILHRFLSFLELDSPKDLTFETLWILTNIAAGPTSHTNAIIDNGFLPRLVAMLSHANGSVRTQAAWAIGNVIGDREGFRDLVLQENCLPSLLKIWEGEFDDLALRKEAFRIAMWTVDNMCRYKPDWNKMALAFQVLPGVLYETDPYLLKECCWAIARILHQSGRHPVIDSMITPAICHPNNMLTSHPILRAFINLTSSKNANHIQYLLDANVLNQMQLILRVDYIPASCRTSLQVFAVEIISNIASNPHFFRHCITHGSGSEDTIDRVIAILGSETELELKYESCLCIKNLLFHKDVSVTKHILESTAGTVSSVMRYAQIAPPSSKEQLMGIQTLFYILEGGHLLSSETQVNLYVRDIENLHGVNFLLETLVQNSGTSLENMDHDMTDPQFENEVDEDSDDEGVLVPRSLSLKEQIALKCQHVLHNWFPVQTQERIQDAHLNADMFRGFDTMTVGSNVSNPLGDLVKGFQGLQSGEKNVYDRSAVSPPELTEGWSERTLIE